MGPSRPNRERVEAAAVGVERQGRRRRLSVEVDLAFPVDGGEVELDGAVFPGVGLRERERPVVPEGLVRFEGVS